MKKSYSNWWGRFSLSHKISLIGSIALIGSLFLNWFSDIDVFRSGDVYTGLNGPLYFVGINIMILALANIILAVGKTAKWKFLEKFSEVNFGKAQMAAGFGVMYLLMIVNSVYFHSQFGLNILSKKSEIGMFVAMMAAVLLCAAGYMNFRKKFEMLEGEDVNAVEQISRNVQNIVEPVAAVINVPNRNLDRQFSGGIRKEKTEPVVQPEQVQATNEVEEIKTSSIYSERDLRGKTDYERTKMYENLKKMMMKDTMSPEQRRKEREKTVKENAFSSNFGKKEVAAKPQSTSDKPAAKKHQMYRLDL